MNVNLTILARIVFLLQVFWNLCLTFVSLERKKWNNVCGICKSTLSEPKPKLIFHSFFRRIRFWEAKRTRILRILRLYSVNSCLQSSHWSTYIILFLPPCSEKRLVDTHQFRTFSLMLLIIGHVFLQWWLLRWRLDSELYLYVPIHTGDWIHSQSDFVNNGSLF